jgi:hypothetical protein
MASLLSLKASSILDKYINLSQNVKKKRVRKKRFCLSTAQMPQPTLTPAVTPLPQVRKIYHSSGLAGVAPF